MTNVTIIPNNKADQFARKIYLTLLVCDEEYAWQEPEANNIKWYDLLWLFVPIIGILLFLEIVRERKLAIYH